MNLKPDSSLPFSATDLVDADIARPARQAQPLPHAKHSVHLVFPNLLDTLRSLLKIIVIALFVLTFIAQPFRIPSESMERTLLVGDFLLVDKSIFDPAGKWGWLLPYQPIRHGDIIVFHFPLDPEDHLVKRVIGLPGDRIRLENGIVFLNGKRLNEPYAVFEPTFPEDFRDQFPEFADSDPEIDAQWRLKLQKDVRNGEVVVPPHSYFVLGDNRNHSRDSRYWGFVQPATIVGRPFLIYFSLREPSTTDAGMLQDDRLGHEKSPLDSVVDFARWSRMFRIVR